jgi:hypothetical protein
VGSAARAGRWPVPGRPLAVLAYGSLLWEPGEVLGALVARREPCRTPFGVEYGRVSRRWGDGPVLVPHPAGDPVDGALLHLREGVALGEAVEALRIREGLPDARGVIEVQIPDRDDLLVLCAALPHNLTPAEMTPAGLAGRAIASVRAGGTRNGVAYLRGATACGVLTRLTAGYAVEVVARGGGGDLEAVERRLLAFRASDDPEGT